MRIRLLTVVALATLLVLAFASVAGARLAFKNNHKRLPGSQDGNEPSMAISTGGIRYASWQSPGEFARSRNGIRWKNLGSPDPDAIGDVTNAVDAAGSVYNGQICGGATSLHTCIYRSDNHGKTWPVKTQAADSHPGASDRPWIDVYPKYHKGKWNPNHTRVYLEYHTFSPDDLAYVSVSTDGGKTFSPPKNITNDPDALSSSSCNTIPGGVTVDQRNGTVYALWLSGNDASSNSATGCNYSQIGPFNKAWVSTSTDGGNTWSAHLAWRGDFDQSTKIGDNADKIFAALSVDRSGQVHVVLPVRFHDDPVGYVASCNQSSDCKEDRRPTKLLMVTSPDQGTHWTNPFTVTTDPGSHFFPWIAAGSAGRADIIYYRTESKRPNNPKDHWYIKLAQVTGAVAHVVGNSARYRRQPVARRVYLDKRVVHIGGICTFGIFCSVVPNANRNLADSIAVSLDPAGGAEAVWTNDNAKGQHSHIDDACQRSGKSAYARKPNLHGCYHRPLHS